MEEKRNGNWTDAFVNTLKWFFDLPYSSRPILMGSYIATSFLKKPDLAIALCEAGLKANPGDFTILNNMIYAYARDNRLHECKGYIDQFRKVKLDELADEWKVTYLATNGLIEFKEKHLELGKKFYDKAIEWALKLNNNYLIVLAYVNYAKELINNNCPEKDRIIVKLKELRTDSQHKELDTLKEEVLTLYYRTKFF